MLCPLPLALPRPLQTVQFGVEPVSSLRWRVAFLKSGIATRNARFNAMIDEIERVAIKSKAPMLLMGPTGAGKSFLARRVYELKKSRHQLDGKFIDLNCATLHGDGAASTLFDAGRKLYAVSRDAKAKPNDADRLKKFLACFALGWDTVK